VVGVVPSPQTIVNEEIVPSGSEEEKPTVTVDPVGAGFGEIVLIATVGGRSFTVSETLPDPDPALLVAVTTIVKLCVERFPVDV